MLLNNGSDIDVISQINIDNKAHLVCKLKTVVYVNGIIVKYIILDQHEFKEYSDQVTKESNEIVVKESNVAPSERVSYPSEEVLNNELHRREILEDNIE